MNDDLRDAKVIGVLKAARPEPRPGWEDRVVTRLAQREPRTRTRRRWVIAAVTVAAGLIGIGVLTPPWTGKDSTWNRVLAATMKASSIHVRARIIGPDGETMSESWMAPGFSRHEDWRNGNLQSLTIRNDAAPRRYINYSESERGRRGIDYRLPPRPPLDFTSGAFAGSDAFAKLIEGWASSGKVENRRLTRTTNTGTVELVEATRTVGKLWTSSFAGGEQIGDKLRIRAEVDPRTDRLLSVTEYRLEDGSWKETYATQLIEYDAPISDKLKEFEFPHGTVVERTRWWDERTDKVLAEADADGWNIKVHALDLDLDGNIYLTFSLWTEKRELAGWPAAEAVDNKQTRYGRFPGSTVANDYGIIVMRPEVQAQPKVRRPPRTATVTFWPRLDENGGGASVVFRNLPLSPPKPVRIYEEQQY